MKKNRFRWMASLLSVSMVLSLTMPVYGIDAEEQLLTETTAAPETEAMMISESESATIPETEVMMVPETETVNIQEPEPVMIPETENSLETLPETQIQDIQPETEQQCDESDEDNNLHRKDAQDIPETPDKKDETQMDIKVESASSKDQVKRLIEKLKGEPLAVTAQDAPAIQAAAEAYNMLSAEDRKALDTAETYGGVLADGVGSGQPYGRILEANQWALYALTGVNSVTTLAAGTYSTVTTPALISGSSKGKSTSSRVRLWTVDQVIVDASHNVMADIYVNSTAIDYIEHGGQIYYPVSVADGNTYFSIPIDLNSTFYLLAHSTVMPTAIAYAVTTQIEEPAVQTTASVRFQVYDQNNKQMTGAIVSVNEGKVKAANGIFTLARDTTYTVEVSCAGYKSRRFQYKAVNSEDYKVTLEKGYRLTLTAEDQATGTVIGQAKFAVNVVNKERTPVAEYKRGVYDLDPGVNYRVTATADGYETTSKTFTYSKDTKLSIQLTKKGSGQTSSTEAVKKVIAMIAALPSEPKEADRAAIVAAQRAYIALEKDEEAMVTNKARLDKIIEKLGPKKLSEGAGTYTYTGYVGSGDRGDYQVESLLTSAHNAAMFRIVNAVIHVAADGSMTAEITLSGIGYRNIRLGDAMEALAAEESVGGFRNVSKTPGIIKGQPVSYTDADGTHNAYRFVMPLVSLDHPIMIAAQSWSHDSVAADKTAAQRRILQADCNNSYTTIWYERALIFTSQNLKKQSSGQQGTGNQNGNITERPETPENQDVSGDYDTSGGSQTVGKYAFQWSGGTMGHVTIYCSNVEVVDGQAYATISFVRKASVGGTAKFSQVRSLGQTIGGDNVFRIPVHLNANTTIEAFTSAMSQGHWVSYTIYVGVSDKNVLAQVGQDGEHAGAIESTVGEQTAVMDTAIPEIVGLKAKGEVEITYTDRLKIYEYEDGYYLIEVDVSKDTARASMDAEALSQLLHSSSEDQSKVNAHSSEEEAEYQSEDADEAADEETTDADEMDPELAYKHQIIKYLVVPEHKEVPVGLDAYVVMITQPVDAVYMTSECARQLIDALHLKKITWTEGVYDDWDLRSILKNKTDLIIESSEILPVSKDQLAADWARYEKLVSRATQMQVAAFVDRSGDEKNALAQAEWYKAYGILFNAQTEAQKAYEKVISKATPQEKKDALEALKLTNVKKQKG